LRLSRIFNPSSKTVKNYYPELVPGAYYHVFNRGNNRETVFFKAENYRYFLGKYAKYLSPYLDTYAYCLLPNHFHLLVRVRTLEEIHSAAAAAAVDFPGFQNLESLPPLPQRAEEIPKMISNQFRICFMSYAKSINKQENRVGSLFQKNFKRLHVHSPDYFTQLILYIHANPQSHGIIKDYRDWPHSSYPTLLSNSPTLLQRTVVIDWFNGKESMEAKHQQYLKLKYLDAYEIED
jgi:REP element-mobilizing transposase RayT